MPYDTLPERDTVLQTMEALKARNFTGYFLENKEEALAKIKELIPDGAEVMTGSSVTLEQIGFVDLLKSGNHPWKNWKDIIIAEKDPKKQSELRKQATLSTYFLVSAHAVTEDGIIIDGSNTGSQHPSYAFSSDNLILVVGTQKIVPTLEAGMKRLREYVFPLEHERMKALGAKGSNLSKILIIEKEVMPRRKIHVIFVNEVLGF